MLRTLVLLGALAGLMVAAGDAAAWHVSVTTCVSCAGPSTITTPEAPWLLPFHPPNPCLGAADAQVCAEFP